MSKGTNIVIGTVAGTVLGSLYYWLVWETFFHRLFDFETTTDNWYLPIFVIILAIGFGINFGLQFGFDNREYFSNLLYCLLAAVYITAFTALLILAIWIVTNPFARLFLIAGLVVMFIPAAKSFIAIIFSAN